MVAKCANPDCNCEFRELSKGRLFLLPPTYQFPDTIWKVQRMIDHCHWLCPACTLTHTIVLEGNHPAVKRLAATAVSPTIPAESASKRDNAMPTPARKQAAGVGETRRAG